MRDETVIVRPGDTLIYPVVSGVSNRETSALATHLESQMPKVTVTVIGGGGATVVYRPAVEPEREPGPLTVDLAAQRAFEAGPWGDRAMPWHEQSPASKAAWRKVALAVLQDDAR